MFTAIVVFLLAGVPGIVTVSQVPGAEYCQAAVNQAAQHVPPGAVIVSAQCGKSKEA